MHRLTNMRKLMLMMVLVVGGCEADAWLAPPPVDAGTDAVAPLRDCTLTPSGFVCRGPDANF